MDPLIKREKEGRGGHPPNGHVATPVSSEAIKAVKEVSTLNSKVVNDMVRVDKGSTPHE